MIDWRWPAVVAHRCGGRLAPENAVEGLERAAAAGVGGVEFDAMLAACGTPVVIHDETLERTTDGTGAVGGQPWSELRHRRLRDAHGRLTEARLPSLAQVLDACERLGLAANVEIKPAAGTSAQTGDVVARAVAEFVHRRPFPVLLTSFDDVALAAARPVGLPMGHLFDQAVPDASERAQALGCTHLVVNTRHMSRHWFERVRASGLAVAVYTENDPQRARQLWTWGLDAVITDDPVALLAAAGAAHLA